MSPRPRSARLRVRPLEGREVPANLTVTYSPVSHTLTVLGDATNNDVTFFGDPADPTHFTLFSSGTINAQPPATGVKNIVVRMLGGDDTVTFDAGAPARLQGSLTVNGGDGANSLSATNLSVARNLSVTNGTDTTGTCVTSLANLSVGGSLTVTNGDGPTLTHVNRTAAGVSTIRGSVRVTNGAGRDDVVLEDTNVVGSVKINNGTGGVTGAGFVTIDNQFNTAFRSVIRGNVTVAFQDGAVSSAFLNGIFDTEVLGNVTFNTGSGTFRTWFGDNATSLQTRVHGNLTVTGTGNNRVVLGTDPHGVVTVGGALTVATGAGNDSVGLNGVRVNGATRFLLGQGNNGVGIDDSTFAGRFTYTGGAGDDSLVIETLSGTAAGTVFQAPVAVDLGDAVTSNSFITSGTTDAYQALVIDSTFVVHTHNASTWTPAPSQTYFRFGGSIQWVT